MKVPFGKPFPAIDSVSLRDGVASGLTNGYINELDDYHKVPGLTLFATHGDAAAVDGLYETLSGVFLGVTNGKVVRLNSNGTFTAFTGDTVTVGSYCYWTEDGQHVYLAHGGKLARIDLTNLTVTLLNENTPSAVTHVCRSKGWLHTNGNDRIMGSSIFDLAQVFDNTGQLSGVATLTDKPGWILASGSRSVSPGNAGRIYLSKDNGLTWTKVYTATANNFIMCVAYMGAGVVLAGTGITTGKILRSTDYGETWADLGQQGSSTLINFIAKVDTNIAIAGAGSGAGLGEIFRSTNNGASWANIATPADFGKTVNGCVVWSATVVTVGAGNASDVAHIWRSTDGGATFTDVATLDAVAQPIDGVKVSSTIGLMSVYAHPIGKIYRSTDAGATWATVGTIPNLQSDAIPFAFLLTSTGDLLFGTAGNNVATGGAQIWKSTDDGVSWSRVVTLDDSKEAIVNSRGLAETHTPGQVIALGRTLLATSTTASAAKWQTGVGRNAPQGDVFSSEDISNNYEAVDSWERFNAEQVPDAVNGVFEVDSLVFAAGPRSIEINYNSVDPDFPWALSDPSLPFGLLAPHSWVGWKGIGLESFANAVMYLTDTDGPIQVVQFRGRSQHSISQEYAAILNDRTLVTSPATARAWGVVIRGLPHYVLSFPADNLTICYNLLKNHWWRWGVWNGSSFEAAVINAYGYSKAMNRHFIGDRRANGRIYTLEGLTENGTAIRFELTSGHVSAGGFGVKQVSRYLYKVKRGQALDTSEPVFTHAWRDDGRPTFAPARSVPLGLTGETEFFGHVNRGGMYRTRQHRIVHDDTQSDFIFSEADES